MGLFGSSRPPPLSEVRSKSYRVFRSRQWASLERGAGCPRWVKGRNRSRALRKAEWVVYAKPPFGGPEAVLAYLSRYTHRVAIANSRLITCDEQGVTFKWKDYRLEGRDRYKRMTLATDEFIRRFLIHVLPKGLHRIRRSRATSHSSTRSKPGRVETGKANGSCRY